jgi:hypothetical protein
MRCTRKKSSLLDLIGTTRLPQIGSEVAERTTIPARQSAQAIAGGVAVAQSVEHSGVYDPYRAST